MRGDGEEAGGSELERVEAGGGGPRQALGAQQRAQRRHHGVARAQLAHLLAQLGQHGVVGLVVARLVLQQRDLLLLQLLLLAALHAARPVQPQQRAPRLHVRVQRLPTTRETNQICSDTNASLKAIEKVLRFEIHSSRESETVILDLQ